MATIDGSIQLVKVVTDAELRQNGGSFVVAGRMAQPIQGFDTLTKRASGGNAIPVYVVSDAQIANGTFRLKGGSALPMADIDVVGADVKTIQGAAIPVYVVSGTLGAGGAATIVTIPYSVDFTALADGPLPSVWHGDSAAISGSKLIITPTVTNLIVNGDFSAWTADNPNGWAVVGENATNEVTENPAGQAQMIGNTLIYIEQNLVVSKFVSFALDVVALASGTLTINNPSTQRAALTGTGAQVVDFVSHVSAAGTSIRGGTYPVDATIDNVVAGPITNAMALVETTENDINVKANVTFATATARRNYAGVVLRADSLTDPQNYLLFVGSGSSAIGATLYKCVGGVVTQLTEKTCGVGPTDIEVHANGASLELFTGGTSRGTIIVDEAAINSNTIHGVFSTNGGNTLQSFFCLSPTPFITVFMGGSNTTGSPSTWYWGNILNSDYITDMVTNSVENAGYGGAGSWYGLFRYPADVVAEAPDVLFIEFAVNDKVNYDSGSRTNLWLPSAEALIRKLRAALPNTRIVFCNLVLSDSCYVGGSSNEYVQSKDLWVALCTKYDIDYKRVDAHLETLLGTATPTLEQCAPYGDGVHFTVDGHQEIADMMSTSLADWYPHTGAGWTGDITDYDPPYFDDLADFMHDPIARNGTDNDGETGTGWSTVDTTARQSSTADDTISWTGTFSSCGLDHNWTGVIAWSVDGGAETQVNLAAGLPGVIMFTNFARGVHTVTIRVVSGTVRVNRFLAI